MPWGPSQRWRAPTCGTSACAPSCPPGSPRTATRARRTRWAACWSSNGPGALIVRGSAGRRRGIQAIVAISSQVPSAGWLGRRRATCTSCGTRRPASVTSSSPLSVTQSGQIPSAIAAACRPPGAHRTGRPGRGCRRTWLLASVQRTSCRWTFRVAVRPDTSHRAARQGRQLLKSRTRPVILAAGAVVRAGAESGAARFGRGAPCAVAVTSGRRVRFRGARSVLQSWLEDWHPPSSSRDADVLLVVGSGLGEPPATITPSSLTAGYSVEADLGKLEANHPSPRHPLRLPRVRNRAHPPHHPASTRRRSREADSGAAGRVAERLEADVSFETWRAGRRTGRRARTTYRALDMTISATGHGRRGTHGCRARELRPGRWRPRISLPGCSRCVRSAPGGRRVMAVSGDGGRDVRHRRVATAVSTTCRLRGSSLTTRGYGILRDTCRGVRRGVRHRADPTDFAALAQSFGVTARPTTPEDLEKDLAAARQRRDPKSSCCRHAAQFCAYACRRWLTRYRYSRPTPEAADTPRGRCPNRPVAGPAPLVEHLDRGGPLVRVHPDHHTPSLPPDHVETTKEIDEERQRYFEWAVLLEPRVGGGQACSRRSGVGHGGMSARSAWRTVSWSTVSSVRMASSRSRRIGDADVRR